MISIFSGTASLYIASHVYEEICLTVMFAYVGSFTTRERNARGNGISVFRVEPKSGALELEQQVTELSNPSYLTLNRAGDRLYTVHGDGSDVSGFRVDRERGSLQFINRQGTDGQNPVHLALDPGERFLVVSNHIGQSLAVLPLAADGALQPLRQLVPLGGPPGPHRLEQQHAKPHFNLFDPSGRFVVVPDKGLDRVFSFVFDSGNGSLSPAAVPFVATREGAGPRHAVFHPDRPSCHVVNELDSTVTTYRFDARTGGLEPLQILSTLPSTFTGNSRAAGIVIDAAGRTLYASNRGHDSITAFRIDAGDGRLSFIDVWSTQGRTPRFFALTPDNRRLYALNEDSDSIVVFDVETSDGRLSANRVVARCGSPVCLLFAPEAA